MNTTRETENDLGQDPVSIEEAKILKLHPNTVIVGLSNLLDKKIDPLLSLLKKEQLTTEENWQLQAYEAVNSLIDPNVCEYSLMPKDKDYQQAVRTTLRYMRFLGFSDSELSAERIIQEEDEVNFSLEEPIRQEKEAGIIYFNRKNERPLNELLDAAVSELKEAETIPMYRALQNDYEQLLAKNKALEAQLNKTLGIADDQTVLLLLESLTRSYEQFPTYEQMTKDSRGSEELFQAVMNPKPKK